MKRLLPFLLLIIALISLVAIPLLRLDKYRSQIAESLSQKLGHRVVIGRLEAVFVPPALRLRDFAIMNPTGDAPLLQAEQVTAPISWPALFKGRIAPGAIHLRGWTAKIHRQKDGAWAWDEWMRPVAHVGEKAGWPVRTITFDRGECRAIDPFGPGPEDFVVQILQGGWEGDRKYISMNGVFTSLPSPVSFLFQGNGDFLAQSGWTGVLGLTDETRQLKLDLNVSPQQIKADGKSAAWRFDTVYGMLRYYGRLPIAPPAASPTALLENWESHFDSQGSTLSFSHNSTVAGGRSEIKGAIVYGSGFPAVSVDIGLQSAKLQPIEAALFGSTPMEGTATGLAHFNLLLTSSSWTTLNGQGALEIKEGRYYLPNSSTQGMARARAMHYLVKKYPGFLANGMAFSKASVRWQTRNGVFSFDDAFCDLGDMKVAAAGSYDAAHQGVDAYVRVQVKERNKELIKELSPAYVTPGSGVSPIQPMQGQIQGTPGEWRLRVVRGSKVPAATASKLSRTIRSK